MSENMKTVFEMAAPEPIQGQPVKVVGGKLLKDTGEQIFAELVLSSASDKQITTIITDLIGYDVTGKQIEKQEHQYLDLELMNGESCGENVQVRMQDNRVRKLSAAIKTAVFSDGTIWSLKEQERRNTQEKIKNAAGQTAGRIKKPLIAVIAVVLVAALAFVGLKLFGGKNVQVGDIIKMGHYPQTAKENDKTPIEWIVLDVKGDKALLISRYALDAAAYNEERADVTWETCTLRKWLNGEFYNKAFSAGEKRNIVLTTNENPDNAEYGTEGGNATQDNVFLLSLDEADKYFSGDEDRVCTATEHAKANDAIALDREDIEMYQEDFDYPLTEGACWWWLRSPGGFSDYAAFVNGGGSVCYLANIVNYSRSSVRPCVWVRLF